MYFLIKRAVVQSILQGNILCFDGFFFQIHTAQFENRLNFRNRFDGQTMVRIGTDELFHNISGGRNLHALSKHLNSNIAYSLKTLSKQIRIFSTNKQSRLLIAKKNYGMKDAKTKEVRLIHVIRDLS